MHIKGHHCRNCGYLCCSKCSSKWPNVMLPTTYHNNEKLVRICDNCNYLTERFMNALLMGNYEETLAIYTIGNVNLHTPICFFEPYQYPLHLAIMGQNIFILKWLVEDRLINPLDDYKNEVTNGEGQTLLAVAAKYANVDIMEYLTRVCGCNVTLITDIRLLHRALHVALKVSI